MTDPFDDTVKDGKALWQAARRSKLRQASSNDEDARDWLAVASMIDDKASAAEREALETRLAEDPDLLALWLETGPAQGQAAEAPPRRITERAKALAAFEMEQERISLWAWIRAAGWPGRASAMAACAAYLLVCFLAFDLGIGEGEVLAASDPMIEVAELSEDPLDFDEWDEIL